MLLTVLVGTAVVIGLLGIVVPVLPGLLLTWGAVVAHGVVAATGGDGRGWWLAGVVTIVYAAGLATQYLLPGRALKSQGIPWTTTAAGVALAVVGFVVVPVVGAVAGFVLGIFLVELYRLRSAAAAWPSTLHALRAVGLSMLIELTTGLVILGAWTGLVLAGLGR